MALGCASLTPYDERPYDDWVKNDGSLTGFEIDHDACVRIATVPETAITSGFNGKAMRTDEELFLDCMQQAGWRLREDWEREHRS